MRISLRFLPGYKKIIISVYLLFQPIKKILELQGVDSADLGYYPEVFLILILFLLYFFIDSYYLRAFPRYILNNRNLEESEKSKNEFKGLFVVLMIFYATLFLLDAFFDFSLNVGSFRLGSFLLGSIYFLIWLRQPAKNQPVLIGLMLLFLSDAFASFWSFDELFELIVNSLIVGSIFLLTGFLEHELIKKSDSLNLPIEM